MIPLELQKLLKEEKNNQTELIKINIFKDFLIQIKMYFHKDIQS